MDMSDPKDADFVRRRLACAEAMLAGALQQLLAAQRAAVLGIGDSATLDAAIVAYRRAKAGAAAARDALAFARAAQDPAGVPLEAAAPAAPPIEAPSPRLLFARWLVETGRLSDQLAA